MINNLIMLEQEALALKNKGNLREAIEVYKKILRENPNYEFGMCFYHIALCLEDLGELDDAKENYIKAIEYDKEDDLRLGGFASFLYMHGDAKEALDIHLKLLSLEKKRHLDTSNTITAITALAKKIGLQINEVIKENGTAE